MTPLELESELLTLEDAADADEALVGGKAQGLGQLIRQGFRIPPGFIVPANVGLEQRPPGLAEAIERIAGGRDDVLFAVRSSASGEDSEHASWAGQFETLLRISRERVWEAVEACRASLRSERVADYAADRGLPHPEAMAVVVQQMVDASKAGTMFTKGLAQGDALVIEAVRGIGEAVVAGTVTPENITVERDGSAKVQAGEGNGPVLTYEEITALGTVGFEIEQNFGRPMDIEWALDGEGELFILQARPITATSAMENRPYLGWKSEGLFRWGPTAGRYFYISDYVLAACQIESVANGGQMPWTVLTFDDTHQMVWLTTWDGWHDLAEHCFRVVCLNEEATGRLRRRYDDVCPRLEAFFDLPWEHLERDELRRAGGDFYDAVSEFWLSTLPAELGNYGGEKVLDEALQAHVPHPEVRAEVARMLFETEGLSIEQRKKLELAADPDTKAHWEAHRFDLSSYLGPRERTLAEFEEEKLELTGEEVARIEERAYAADAARRQSIENLKLPPEASRIGRCLASTLAWQEERKRVANRSMAIKQRLLQRTAEVLGLQESDLWDIGFYELLAALDGEPLPEPGERPGVLFSTGIERLTPGEARALWLAYAHPPIESPDAVSVSGGKVACVAPAPITGIARVVTAASEDREFSDGDILFAPRTAPEFELLMRRAGAVVTDSGGQTSHTAVFCRENSLPGIVGLANATRQVRDGQTVTLHAERVDAPGTIEIHHQQA